MRARALVALMCEVLFQPPPRSLRRPACAKGLFCCCLLGRWGRMRTPTLALHPDAEEGLTKPASPCGEGPRWCQNWWVPRCGDPSEAPDAGPSRNGTYVWGALPAPLRTPSASLLALSTCSAVACWTATDTMTLNFLIILAFSTWGSCEHAIVAHAKASLPHLPLQWITKGKGSAPGYLRFFPFEAKQI